MLPGKTYTPEELLWMAWRRRWAIVLPFVVVVLGTFLVSLKIPNRYRSETLILVVPPRVSESYVRATLTTPIEDRLRSIQQQILSRTRLELIIREFELYPAERRRMPMEDVVQRMRLDVEVNVVRGDAFRVAYVSDDPRKAMQVADRLASLFINENLQDREMLGEATADFLQTQLEAARRRLSDQEMKVAEFQRRHAGELPSEREANIQALHNLQLQVQSLIDSANRDKDRRILLERTLADLDADAQLRPDVEANLAALGVRSGQPAAAPGPGTTEDQLETARNNLKAIELRLQPQHPDVQYARRLVRELEGKVAAEARQSPPAVGSDQPARPRTAEEASMQRRAQEVRREIASLDLQLESKQAEEKRLRNQIADYEKRLAATPIWEAELTALTRDYETLQRGYASLLEKQESSKMSAALERSQSGEVFRVLDRARLPEAPASPNRLLINLLGAAAGLGLGLGLVALLVYRDQRLQTEDDVLRLLGLPVLAGVPAIETRGDRRRKRRVRIIAAASAVGILVILVGAGVYAWTSGLVRLPLSLR